MIRVGFSHAFDAPVLNDYFRKRAEWYEKRIAAPPDASQRDEFDDRSYIVLASDGQQCVGGLRATVRRPGDARLLPTESLCGGLRLGDLFPDVDLATTPHAELSKLVVVSDHGPPAFTNEVAFRLLHFLFRERNPEPDVAHAFISGSRPHARLYAGLGRMMGLQSRARDLPLASIPSHHQQAITGGRGAVVLRFALYTPR